jgi:hypothetical protein
MSVGTAVPDQDFTRHPLGLPQGSVRAFLSLMICVLFWLLLFQPDVPPDSGLPPPVPIPLNLYCLLGLVFLSFVTYAHDRDKVPHALPIFLRLLILAGTAATIGYLFYSDPIRLQARLTPDRVQLPEWPKFLGATAGGFVVGHLLRYVPGRNTKFFGILQNWLSVVTVLLMVVEIVIHAFIMPTRPEPRAVMLPWECILSALVAGYYGMRA